MRALEELRRQRWDDHRFYHHSRVNQTLHLLSALCFLASYVLIFVSPIAAAFVGWLLAMVLRQVGHFLFEPRSFDAVNRVSHRYKESVKVGYNLRRKVVLLAIWIAAPMLLWLEPTVFGLLEMPSTTLAFAENLSLVWLAVGIGAVIFRAVQLFFLADVRSGLVWVAKIATDPFHDIKIYRRAPYYLLRGEWYDEMTDWYDESRSIERS